MGAFDGLRSIRIEQRRLTGAGLERAVELIRAVDGDATGLDFQAASQLGLLVGEDAPLDDAYVFYRHCIAAVILTRRSSWARSITLGREKLLRQLERDQHQCFRSAKLLDAPPTDDVVKWWDDLTAQVRQARDAKNLENARIAEKQTLDYERARLIRLGIKLEPKWIAIEDNTAGYDVLSYDPGEFGPTNRLIEVKSTVTSPLRFFVSRNEWDQAVKYAAAYHFHVWNLAIDPPRLYERTVADIQPHIPTDNELGKWTNAVIPIGG